MHFSHMIDNVSELYQVIFSDMVSACTAQKQPIESQGKWQRKLDVYCIKDFLFVLICVQNLLFQQDEALSVI